MIVDSSTRSETLRGIAGSPGVAIGRAVVIGPSKSTQKHRHVQASEVASEYARYQQAVESAQQELREMTMLVGDRRAEASILEAYLLMLGDETLAEAVRVQIEGEHRCAEWAVQSAIQVIASRLAALDGPPDCVRKITRRARALNAPAPPTTTAPAPTDSPPRASHDNAIAPRDTPHPRPRKCRRET